MNNFIRQFTAIKLIFITTLLLALAATTSLAQEKGEDRYKLRVDIPGIAGEGLGGAIDAVGTDSLLTAAVDSGTGASSGRPKFNPLVITKAIDSATPKLFDACAGGDHLRLVQVSWIRSNHMSKGGEVVYFKVILEDVQITSVRSRLPNQNQASGIELGPVEEVTFSFGRITWIYTLPNGGTIKESYDVRAGRRI
ncbi:MAG: Hcp family type VI secretion system effector [Blastocatellia bacterium]